jgi:serine protease inhibitor
MQQHSQVIVAGTALAALLATVMALSGCGASVSTAQNATGSPGSSTVPTAVAQAQTVDTPVDPAIVAADNAFGLKLLDTLLAGNDGNNIAVSPLSVALALQVLYNGAAGSTREAMAQTLGLGALSDQALNDQNAALQASLISPDPKVQLTVANSLWIDQSGGQVLPGFTQIDETYYGATVGDLAGAPGNVNAWVDSETHGLIPTLLPPGQYKYAIIANVLYFKGEWTTSFDPSETAAAPFTLSGGGLTSAELMHQTGPFAYASGTLHGSGFQAVRIPYGQGRFSMLVVLPDAAAGITSFVAGMSIADLTDVIAQLQPSTVTLALPRFTASYGDTLVPALASMGMDIAFHPSADFSALAPAFWINVVQHKTVVEVDETGTVAAAATGVGMTNVTSPEVLMNHPFFYAIRDDKTGELIFIGVLMNPS